MRLPIQVEAIIFRRNDSKIECLLLKRQLERNGFWQPVRAAWKKERPERKPYAEK
jgi:hypothetical protein